MKEDLLEELNLKEDHERECKLATGGLPESIWETYSSFANTNGGTILLGIKEHRDSFTVEGLTEKQIIKWLKDPYSDAAEYKMWGNGVALPNVCFVLAGIVYYSQFPPFLL